MGTCIIFTPLPTMLTSWKNMLENCLSFQKLKGLTPQATNHES
jgi:hypothetical protein